MHATGRHGRPAIASRRAGGSAGAGSAHRQQLRLLLAARLAEQRLAEQLRAAALLLVLAAARRRRCRSCLARPRLPGPHLQQPKALGISLQPLPAQHVAPVRACEGRSAGALGGCRLHSASARQLHAAQVGPACQTQRSSLALPGLVCPLAHLSAGPPCCAGRAPFGSRPPGTPRPPPLPPPRRRRLQSLPAGASVHGRGRATEREAAKLGARSIGAPPSTQPALCMRCPHQPPRSEPQPAPTLACRRSHSSSSGSSLDRTSAGGRRRLAGLGRGGAHGSTAAGMAGHRTALGQARARQTGRAVKAKAGPARSRAPARSQASLRRRASTTSNAPRTRGRCSLRRRRGARPTFSTAGLRRAPWVATPRCPAAAAKTEAPRSR